MYLLITVCIEKGLNKGRSDMTFKLLVDMRMQFNSLSNDHDGDEDDDEDIFIT